jgi:hypothetical protein
MKKMLHLSEFSFLLFLFTLTSCINADYKIESTSNSSSSSGNQKINSEKCVDMDSYNLGFDIAQDQRQLAADCNYLFTLAKTQRDNINYYCFCKGVEDYRSRN